MKILHHYNDTHHNTNSAEIIIPIIQKFIQPNSVIDVGCGIGQWLKMFHNYGISDYLGLDGEHVLQDNLMIDKSAFVPTDLSKPKNIKIGKRFDLAISLEVAEHLPKEVAQDFVFLLTELSDTIIFSAAIPGQTGENHLNEQWHSYWQDLFYKRGYSFLDVLRPELWNDERVNWWYRQNIFLVTNQQNLLDVYQSQLFDGRNCVHPRLLEMHIGIEQDLLTRLKKKSHPLFIKKIINGWNSK